MFRAWRYVEPPIHDHPHHDALLACRCFKGKLSLSGSALDVFMNNLDRYSDEDLDCIKYFPAHMKSLITRKLLSSRTYVCQKNVNYKRLISVMLHDKTEEVDFTFYAIDDDIMKSLKVCKSLQSLRILDAASVLSAEAIIDTIEYTPELIELQLERCAGVTDKVMAAIARNCTKLRKLDVRGCRNISDEGLLAITELKGLIALDISGSKVTDKGLYIIISTEFSNNLEDIRLDHCPNIKDFDFNLFATKCEKLTMFSCLDTPIADKMNNWNSQHLKNLKQINWAIKW